MFVPAICPRFPLDALLAPFARRLSADLLISVPELLRSHVPEAGRLWVDSGGYALLADPAATVSESPGGLGSLVLADLTVTPQLVFDLQAQHAHVGFTLDFPAPESTGEDERRRRDALSLANARWAARQERRFQLYVCAQPGQDLAPLLDLAPDGIALGGLAPLSRHPAVIHERVTAARAALPPHLPLHVFGIGHPDSVRAAHAAGATSVDSTGPQRRAVDGADWSGVRLPGPSTPERLTLAVRNLQASLRAAEGDH